MNNWRIALRNLIKEIKNNDIANIVLVCLFATLLSFFILALISISLWTFLIFIPALIILYLRFVYQVTE